MNTVMNRQLNFDPLSKEELAAAYSQLNSVITNVEQVIFGKRPVIELVLLALIAGGHVLIEDVPGVGKTSLVSAVARSVDCGFKRIQFTPDLMPSDVTGFSIYNQKNGEFEFRSGAVMSNLILADEINRASAKTQASLLEAMEERQVTVDSVTYPLDPPFMVLATQNPLESFGTYPLPEAQIDRFLLKLTMGYPSLEEERQMLRRGRHAQSELCAVISRAEVIALSKLAERVYASPEIERYIVELVAATRSHSEVVLGSSPRGSIALFTCARVLALLRNRNYVTPDDIKYLAPYVLAHRLMLSHEAKSSGISAVDCVTRILDSVIVPV